ncbi:hypothetical protein INS49_010530 [Diaporthe citri]|uniref:uncharacterized protein n=1 Tax=Diaporthe citri TaxID=83186 RepID=UPI001C80B111|nr:uncharacterized protein INS49_010530 [Diaporthe citri]KAG6362300.1 hypothetical protein INS49_010530 [Diaporthe citri]
MPILPLTYQSRDISFSDWISLVTLCLAPLVAHVAAGAPQPSYLTRRRLPKWHDLLCHYNPTSILWRYFAVTDRRLRAKHWDVADIAAANALFWTDAGWDGSEKVAEQSLSFCSRLPAHARTEIASWEMIKTVVVGLQAAQAFYSIGGSLFGPGTSNYIFRFALDNMFLPIGCLGLYIFCAAFWITDNFAFIDVSDPGSTAVGHRRVLPERQTVYDNNKLSVPETQIEVAGRLSLDSFLDHPAAAEHHGSRFFPTSRWSSRVLRICWILPLLALTAFCIIYAAPWSFWHDREWIGWIMPASAFTMVIFYLVVFGCSSLILLYYFIRGANTTTIIPCASMLWYKIYTIVISVMMALVLILVALETARTPCGSYSAWPPAQWHGTACPQKILPVGQNEGSGFGLAFRSRNSSETRGWTDDEFRVLNVTGVCLVSSWSEVAQRAAAFGLASMLEA